VRRVSSRLTLDREGLSLVTTDDAADLQEITALYHAYGDHFDHGRSAEFAELFAPTGEVVTPNGTVVAGTEQLRGMVATATARPVRLRHFVDGITIEIDGRRARGAAHVVANSLDPEGTLGLFLVGRYLDHFERVGGQWRFASRTIVPAAPADLP